MNLKSSIPACILPLSLLFAPQSTVADVPVFSDDFERAELGSDWTVPAPSEFSITESFTARPLDRLPSNNGSFAYVNGHELTYPFALEANMGKTTNQWSGLVFNLNEDPETGEVTFYQFRIRPGTSTAEPLGQIMKWRWDDFTAENRTLLRVFTTPELSDEPLERAPTFYRLRVESHEPGVFVVSVIDGERNLLGDEGFTVVDDGEDPDAGPVFTDGGIGILGRASARFDTFALYLMDAPASNFEEWRVANFSPDELDNETVSGPFGDPDGDGVWNLMEYALGMDPNKPGRERLPIDEIQELEISSSFEDDFARDELGMEWTVPAPGDAWIDEDQAFLRTADALGGAGGSVVYYNGQELSEGFVLEADIGFLLNQWSGLVFHLNEDSETGELTYYHFRIQPGGDAAQGQLLKWRGSGSDFSLDAVFQLGEFAEPLDRYPEVYRLRVESDATGVFRLSVFDGETDLLGEGGVTVEDDPEDPETGEPFTGGYGGLQARASARTTEFGLAMDDENGIAWPYLTLTFTRPSGIDDLEYRVQTSPDLLNWSDEAVHVSSTEEANWITTVFRDSVPVAETEGRRFLRLSVTKDD